MRRSLRKAPSSVAPALLALALLSCRAGEAPPAVAAAAAPAERARTLGALEARAEERPPVLFVGWDGADWQAMEPWIQAGVMPNLRRLREEGSWGDLETETPPLSPLLWTTMMTGVSPLEHGVLDFSRFQPGSGVREPITREERQAPALWNAATWAGQRVAVLGLWATYPAEAVSGTLVSDRLFGFLNIEDEPPPGAVYPPEAQSRALATLRAVWSDTGHAALRGYLPWLAEAEYRAHAESTRPYEHPISALRRILVETELYHRLFLAAWDEGPPDLTVLYLQGTDSIGHVFAPYAPPRQASIAAEEFERYRRVPELYFRDVDRRLGECAERVRAAGGTLVLASDHGFYWGEGRPERLSSFANATAAKWHRKEGIYLVAGPGISPGRRPNATIRQLFPTLLALAGLPAAAGAESRPFAGVEPPAEPPFDYGAPYRELRARQTAAAPALDLRAADEEIAKLQALGYIGAGEPTRAPAAALAAGSTRTAGSWNNEGVIRLGQDDKTGARRAFERAVELDPDNASALWNLSDLVYAAGELDAADDLLVRAVARELPEGTRFLVGRAIGYQRAGDVRRSLALVDRAVQARPDEREYWIFRGRYRVELGDCAGARGDFARALELAPDDAAVHASAALAALCAGDRAAAVEALRRSLVLEPRQPRVRAMLAEIERGG